MGIRVLQTTFYNNNKHVFQVDSFNYFSTRHCWDEGFVFCCYVKSCFHLIHKSIRGCSLFIISYFIIYVVKDVKRKIGWL